MHGLKGFLLLASSILLAAVGCQPAAEVQTPDPEVLQLIKEQVRANEELVTILKSVEDRVSMKAVWPRLLRHYENAEDLQKRALRISRPSPEILDQFEEEAARLEAARNAQVTELRRIKGLPGGEEFLQQLDAVVKALSRSSGQVGGTP